MPYKAIRLSILNFLSHSKSARKTKQKMKIKYVGYAKKSLGSFNLSNIFLGFEIN